MSPVAQPARLAHHGLVVRNETSQPDLIPICYSMLGYCSNLPACTILHGTDSTRAVGSWHADIPQQLPSWNYLLKLQIILLP